MLLYYDLNIKHKLTKKNWIHKNSLPSELKNESSIKNYFIIILANTNSNISDFYSITR